MFTGGVRYVDLLELKAVAASRSESRRMRKLRGSKRRKLESFHVTHYSIDLCGDKDNSFSKDVHHGPWMQRRQKRLGTLGVLSISIKQDRGMKLTNEVDKAQGE
jgi:hypothetical protein